MLKQKVNEIFPQKFLKEATVHFLFDESSF